MIDGISGNMTKKSKKVENKTVLKNRIAILLDSSGSMQSMRDEVVQGFNKQIETILKNNGDMDTKVSLLTFATKAGPFTFFNESIETLKPLNADSYNPDGWTALYDAIGKTIEMYENLPEINDPNCSFLLYVVTDGHENQSVKWKFPQLAAKIKEVESTKRWTVSYLGAGEGLKDVGSSLGLQVSNTLSGSSLRGMQAYTTASVNSAQNFMSARAGGQQAVQNLFVDPQSGTQVQVIQNQQLVQDKDKNK